MTETLIRILCIVAIAYMLTSLIGITILMWILHRRAERMRREDSVEAARYAGLASLSRGKLR